MANFTFRLETLLRMRENRRDRHRARLARAMEDDENLGQRQALLDRQREELLARCREAAGPGELDVQRLIACRRYDRLLTAQQKQLEEQRQQAAQQTDRRRKALLAADREVQTLKKLEEKQQECHHEQQRRRETKVLDEMAAIRHAALG